MMASPISRQDLGRLRQAMFLGLARQPLGVPEGLQALIAATPAKEPALAVLALAGQRQRFERPRLEHGTEGIPDAARRLHEDQRPILPAGARRLLLRLANGVDKSLADAAVRAAVSRVMRAGFRLHPFDLPRLIGHIKGHAKCMGLAERAYLALTEASSKSEIRGLIHAEITAETWTEFPKAHRVAFLREERRRDPAAARALIEGVFKSETAPVRYDLLSTLHVGLGADDLPFLESVASDRADSVREVVARLIANVPGTSAYAARLAEAAQCFARKASTVDGILKRVGLASAAGVVFTPPKGAGKGKQGTALQRLFDGLSLAEVAAAASLAIDEVLAALPTGESAVLTAFSDRAARDGDEAMLLRLAAHRLERAHPERSSPMLLLLLHALALDLSGPAPAEFGKLVLGSAAWQAVLEDRRDATTPAGMKDDGTLIWTAAILPSELQTAFQGAIAALPPVATRSARDFSDLVLALDTLQPLQR
jgi:hypothetical protein